MIDSGSTPTAVGHSQLLVRRPGTLSQILSGIQRAAQTVLGIYLKHTCSGDTRASSALVVLNNDALYKSMHSLTHSLSTASRDAFSISPQHCLTIQCWCQHYCPLVITVEFINLRYAQQPLAATLQIMLIKLGRHRHTDTHTHTHTHTHNHLTAVGPGVPG